MNGQIALAVSLTGNNSLSTATAKYRNVFTGKITRKQRVLTLFLILFPRLEYLSLSRFHSTRLKVAKPKKKKIKTISTFFRFLRSKTQLANVGFLLFLPLRLVPFWPLPSSAPLAPRKEEPRFKDDSVTVANVSLQRRFRTHPGCTETVT